MTTNTTAVDQESVDAFAGRVFESVLGTMDAWSIYLGDKLGFYDVLAGSGELTKDEIAAQTGTHPRYVNEWLEHQVTTGFIDVDDPSKDVSLRTYALPATTPRCSPTGTASTS